MLLRGTFVMANDTKTHDDLVADWKANAKKHDEKNYWFLRSLKQRSPKKVDRIALELHQEDCTKCANCCRTLRVVVTDDDIPRIAGHLGMAPDQFIATYLERGEEEGCYRIKTSPCPFLGADSKCTIYDERPEKHAGRGGLSLQRNPPRPACPSAHQRIRTAGIALDAVESGV
jgi:hypothetical protein